MVPALRRAPELDGAGGQEAVVRRLLLGQHSEEGIMALLEEKDLQYI